MKASLRLLFLVTAVMAAIGSGACNSNGSKADRRAPQLSLTELQAALDSGSSQMREEPFEVRPLELRLGDDWIGNGVCYGFYRAGQAPGQKGPSEAEILEDLRIITEHWNLIRVYGADDDSRRVLDVIETHELPVRVLLGIWLQTEENDPEGRTANIAQVLQGIELANRYRDIVNAVSVGNETQVFWSGHRMKPENLIRYVRAVRSHVTVPVTTADDYLFWNTPESRPVAAELDFVATHIHPLWNGKTLREAIKWLEWTYQDVRTVHSDRMVVIAETGWATDYNAEKTGPGEQGTLIKGKVSPAAQAEYLIELNEWIESKQVTTLLFEVFDESWKGGGADTPPNEVEKHWGVFNEDRSPKASFEAFLERRGSVKD